MFSRISAGILLAVLMALAAPALAQEKGGEPGKGPDEEGGISKELGDLGQEIRKSMREQGRYLGKKLSEWSEESSSWAADRGLQARVKTTLSGVLGAGSIATVNVDVSDGVVTLQGDLSSWKQVARAVRSVEQVEGVRRVISELTASGSV
ncbi:BON domain-containing protein [Thiohalorhabdus sp. Cl-TMA]|uniref:BON domain-containing protein n=1 Tax=Thiohalorhabdus methylotrophus TaxID=3242694 RepID=A0ABV4TVS9_9GAMM